MFFSSFFASIYSHKNEQKVYENDFGKKFYSDNIWQAHSSEIRKWFMKFVCQQICHIILVYADVNHGAFIRGEMKKKTPSVFSI